MHSAQFCKVVCRIGDPTDPHDLFRVGAHRATSILVMLTDEDTQEEKDSEGTAEEFVYNPYL